MSKAGWIIAGTVAVYGMGVYAASKNIVVQFGGVKFQQGTTTPQLGLKITNPSKLFGIPIPIIEGNIYDSNNVYLGSLSSPGWQYVPANSITTIFVNMNFTTSVATEIVSIIQNLILGNFAGVPLGITVVGQASIGPFGIPFQESVNVGQLLP